MVPSYEPDENLYLVVNELIDSGFKVIVVDDGSGPKYKKYFDNLNTKVISYSENKGKGFALKTGLKYIKDNYQHYTVVTMDSDGQHKVSDAIKLCDYIEKHPKELVLGSRKRDENVPLRSYLGNTITRSVYRMVTKTDIYDTQTGLRCFTDEIIDYMLDIPGDRYEYEMNVLLESNNHNIKIKEITIETIYIDNNSKSHFNTVKDSWKIYKEILKFSLSSIISFLIDYFLCLVLVFTTGYVALSNIVARVVSSLINYNINRKIVFEADSNKSFIKYYLLVLFILILNTIVLTVLSNFLNIAVAKLLTELILFTVSLTIQKKFIFKGSDKNEKIYT